MIRASTTCSFMHSVVLRVSTGIPGYGLRTEMIRIFFLFPLRKKSGLRNVNRKNSGFHFIRTFPGIPLYGTNFRIIPFPKWNFCAGIMETLLFSLVFCGQKSKHKRKAKKIVKHYISFKFSIYCL